MVEFEFLRSKYQKGWVNSLYTIFANNNFRFFFGSISTAIYLAAYIVDLTLILCAIFTAVAANPPKSLSFDFVMDAQAMYKSRSSHIHTQVKEIASTLKLEEEIGNVIWDQI